MKVAVKDACILIDLANCGLLETWFQLGIETHTTDLVLRQVKTDSQAQAVTAFVEAGLLKVQTLSGEQMLKVQAELGHLPIGLEDQSALFLALELEAILLTGDRRLRLEGLRRSVEVCGVLWIFDNLVEHSLLTPRLASVKLQQLLQEGAFLPRDACEHRLKAWGRGKLGQGGKA